jgi:hypothetical protein
MPIARYQLPDGRIARFEVPEGTTPEQAQKIGADFFASQQSEQSGFDLESFSPADFGEDVSAIPQQQVNKQTPGNLSLEAVSAFNRAMFGLADMFGPGAIQELLQLSGSDIDFPQFSDLSEPKGAFAGQGVGTDVAAGIGEGASLAAGGGAALRQVPRLLPQTSRLEAPVVGLTRELTKVNPAVDVAAGGFAGGGQVAGQELGGDAGAVAGSVIGGVTGAGVAQGVKRAATDLISNSNIATQLRSKFSKAPELIEQQTGLPVPAFEKALKGKGLTFGSVVDDVDSLPPIRKGQSLDDYANSIVVKKLKAGDTDDALATRRLEDMTNITGRARKVVDDDLGKDLVKQGFRKGDIVAAKMSGEPTRQEMQRMLRMKRSILANTNKSHQFRPLDVAGEHALARVNFVRQRANELRNELNRIANKSAPTVAGDRLPGPGIGGGLKGADINTANVESAVVNGLDDLGINIPESVLRDTTQLPAFLKQKEVFEGSDIFKNPSAQRMIKDVLDLLDKSSSDAYDAHRLKRQLDQLIDFKKNTPGGLTDAGRNFAKSIRHEINQSIRDISPAYARVNDQLSVALKALDDFSDLMPNRLNLLSPNASKAIGQEMRKFEGQRQVRIPLIDASEQLDNAVRSLGGDFDVSIRELVTFNNTLEDRFGATARGGFAGQIEQANRNLLRPKEEFWNFVSEKVGEQFGKVFGPNDEAAMNTMQKLLVRGK